MKAAVQFPLVVGGKAQTALLNYLEGRKEVGTLSLPTWWEKQRGHACEFLHALMKDNPGLNTLEAFRETLRTATPLQGWHKDDLDQLIPNVPPYEGWPG